MFIDVVLHIRFYTALILKLKLFLLNKTEEKDFKLCKFYNRKADQRV